MFVIIAAIIAFNSNTVHGIRVVHKSIENSVNNEYSDAIELTSKKYKAPEEGDYVNEKVIEDEKLDKKDKAEMEKKQAQQNKEIDIGSKFVSL
jgi:hypothetical protein